MSSTSTVLSVYPEDLSITTVVGVEPADNVKTTLQLSNVSFKAVMYRLKTTAPKRYVVKPSKGVIRSNGTETIQIQLCTSLDASVKDEFRLEYAIVEDGDNVGPKYENVADILAAKGKVAKFKKDISCAVHVLEPKPSSPQTVTKRAQPRAPLSPHTPPSANTLAPLEDAAPVKAAVAAAFGAQPVIIAPQFGNETAAPLGRPVAKPEEPLQRSPVPTAGAKISEALKESVNEPPRPRLPSPPPAPVQVQKQQPIPVLYLIIAGLFVAVAALWSQL